MKVKSLSHVHFLATTWTAVYQAPPSMGFSRQEYWSGLPLPSPIHVPRGQQTLTPWRQKLLCSGHFQTSPTYSSSANSSVSFIIQGLPDAQMVKTLPAMQETRAQSLGQEDNLEKGTAIHTSILTWRIPWTEETSRLQSMGWQRVRLDWAYTLINISVSMRLTKLF